MPPAVIGGAIAAVGAIGGAAIGASSANKAAKSAASSQAAATQSQLTLGRETNKLNKDIYDKNFALLNPFVQRGNVAGQTINDLLGIGGSPAVAQQVAAPMPTTSASPASVGWTGNGPRKGADSYMAGRARALRLNDNPTNPSNMFEGPIQGHPSQVGTPVSAAPIAAPVTTGGISGPQAAKTAFENFANSAGMQFQLDQGRNMIEHAAAGRGALQSGAAMKSLQDYGQSTALQNYFMPYMSLLGGQQAVGAQSGAAVAGVGSNFVNTAAGINAGMGSAIQNGANAASNAALIRGQNNAQMWNGIAGGLGTFASSFK